MIEWDFGNVLDGFGSLFYQVQDLVEFCGEEIKSG